MLVLSVLLEDIAVRFAEICDLANKYDVLEVRIDSSRLTKEHMSLLAQIVTPLLFTYSDPKLIDTCSCQPWMVDIPLQHANHISLVRQKFPQALIQLSVHLTDSEPKISIIEEALSYGCDAVKIACFSSTTVEVLRLLNFLKLHASSCRLSCIPMGDVGQFGRLLAIPLGSFFSFTCLPDRPTAPGQIDIITLHEQYGIKQLSSSTALFGLIGDPVTKSPSHKTHTKLLQAFGVNGLYVKMPVASDEYETALSLITTLGFSGLSVTTPLKQLCGGNVPMNTIVWKHGCCRMINTDGAALIDAMNARISIKNSRVLILGAGAVAHSVASALQAAGAVLFFWNRKSCHASELAKNFHGRVVEDISFFDEPIDVVVDATSARWTEFPFDSSFFYRCGIQLVAEFSFPEHSALLQRAKEQGLFVVPGYELWVRQAAKQLHLWCDLPESEVLSSLQRGAS
jgi:3-dehydroquinate dehydratase/shikimate dehydrogenase